MKLRQLILIIALLLFNVVSAQKNSERTYNIGILMPFFSDGSLKDNKTQLAILDYYAGVKIALSNLEKEGLKAKVWVWDINRKDSSELDQLYNSEEFQNLNLLIGPIQQNQLSLISKRTKSSKIAWVAPLKALTFSNSTYSLNFFSPDSLRMRGLAYAISDQFKKHKFCLISDGSPQSKKDVATLKFVLSSMSSKRKITLHTIDKAGKLTPELPKKDSLIVVNAFSSQNSKVPLINAINNKKSSYIIGHFAWYENLAITAEVKEDKVLYPAINFIQTSDSSTSNFVREFIANNEDEPSRFGYQGYDQMMFLGYNLMMFGPDFLNTLPSANYVGLINTIRAHKIGKRNFNIGIRLISIQHNQDQELFNH